MKKSLSIPSEKNSLIGQKLIVVLGPTASGKSELATKLALRLRPSISLRTILSSSKGRSGQAKKHCKINGAEIISADSRQVYRGMDIGTGKVTRKEMKGIPHHLLDVISPQKRFSVAEYQKLALRAIEKIQKKNKIPILCGGTGFYIQAVIDGIVIPEVPPDWKLRKKLEQKSVEELYQILKKLDKKRAKKIDKNNPRRLIRAIEIIKKTKKPVPALKSFPKFNTLIIGIKKSSKELKKLIAKRLEKRFKRRMIAEVKKLRESGLSWKRLEEFGLEYRWIARYLQKKISRQEMVEKLQKDIEHFAKRQMTWFKKMEKTHKIHWIKNQKEAEKLIRKFIEI